MINFSTYSLIKENFNQMKSLIIKNEKDISLDNGIPKNSNAYNILLLLIGPESTEYKTVSSNPKFKELYGDIPVNEERERVLRPYLGMFAKMFYEEKCSLDIIADISNYILNNKATLNKLKVKNNHTGEFTVLSNLLDIFKFKDSIKANDTRPAYEILTDAIRDKDKDALVIKFINEMPSILKNEFKDESSKNYQKLTELTNTYNSRDISVKQNIFSTFFGNASRKGKISKYKTAKEFLSDFEMMVSNIDDFNLSIEKTREKILSTSGAKLILCDLEKNIIIADIYDYTSSNILGEPSSWCISYPSTSNYWYDNYMGVDSGRKMFFIWNFNLPFNEPLSKIAANLNGDGTIKLVCDKNDVSINHKFDSYLEAYGLEKYLDVRISKEEQEYKYKSFKRLNITKNLFSNVNNDNYKVEITETLNLCKSEDIDISQQTLIKGVLSLINFHNNFEMINLIIDLLGIEKYPDLFTSILNYIRNEHIDYPEDLEELFVKCKSYINFEIFELGNLYIKLSEYKTIYNVIYQYYEPIDTVSKLYAFVLYLSTPEYLDENFDTIFNKIESFSSLSTNDMETLLGSILRKITNIKTNNNFISKINEFYERNEDIDIRIDDVPYLSTGFTTTMLCYDFFKCITYNICDDYNIEKYKNIAKTFFMNNMEMSQTYFNTASHNNIIRLLRVFVAFELDVKEVELHTKIKNEVLDDILQRKYDLQLYMLANENIQIYDYTKYFSDIIIPNKLYNSEENIKHINILVEKIYDTDDESTQISSLTYSKDDVVSNIELMEYLMNKNIFNITILNGLIEDGILLEECKRIIINFVKKNDTVDYILGHDKEMDSYIFENIEDFSDARVSKYYTQNLNPAILLELIEKNVKLDILELLKSGFFSDNSYDDISKKCLWSLNIEEGKDIDLSISKNSLAVIEYVVDNNLFTIQNKRERWGSPSYDILSCNDINKIKYLINKNIIKISDIKLPSYISPINYDILMYLNENDITEDKPQFLFNHIDSLESFIKLYEKYWNDLIYNSKIWIISEYLEFDTENYNANDNKMIYQLDVLNYLYEHDTDTMTEIVKDHYEENKRKKKYSEDVREWIKQKFYTKAKVKKIREMFEIFKNLVKY